MGAPLKIVAKLVNSAIRVKQARQAYEEASAEWFNIAEKCFYFQDDEPDPGCAHATNVHGNCEDERCPLVFEGM